MLVVVYQRGTPGLLALPRSKQAKSIPRSQQINVLEPHLGSCQDLSRSLAAYLEPSTERQLFWMEQATSKRSKTFLE